SEREIDQAARDSRSRSARRAARYAARGIHVLWRAVMHVSTQQAVGELVRYRLADQDCPRRDQPLDSAGGGSRRWMAAQPVRIAAAGHVAGHVVKILGGESEPFERPAGPARKVHLGVTAERAQRIEDGGIEGHGSLWRNQ